MKKLYFVPIAVMSVLAAVVFAAGTAVDYYIVHTDSSGAVTKVNRGMCMQGKQLADNEYSAADWATFGITNDTTGRYPYIIKSGAGYRDMTPAEITASDEAVKTQETAATTGDVQMDAMLRTIAECTKGGTKTYEEVVAIFKGQIDTKKVKEKKK